MQCGYHPQTPAAAICTRCDLPLCGHCAQDRGGKNFCLECAAFLDRRLQQRQQPQQPAVGGGVYQPPSDGNVFQGGGAPPPGRGVHDPIPVVPAPAPPAAPPGSGVPAPLGASHVSPPRAPSPVASPAFSQPPPTAKPQAPPRPATLDQAPNDVEAWAKDAQQGLPGGGNVFKEKDTFQGGSVFKEEGPPPAAAGANVFEKQAAFQGGSVFKDEAAVGTGPTMPDPAPLAGETASREGAASGDVYGGDVYSEETPSGDVYGGPAAQGGLHPETPGTYQGSVVGSGIIGSSADGGGSMQRALLWAGGMGILCAIFWFLVAKVTGMELGIVAIGLGLGVGFAASRGAGRGGGDVAALAVLVTLLSIVGGEYLVFRHVVMADLGLDLEAWEEEMAEHQERVAGIERDGDYTNREIATLMGYTDDEFYDLTDEDLSWMREEVAEEDQFMKQFGAEESFDQVDMAEFGGAMTSAVTTIGFFLWLFFSFKHLIFIGIGCYNALHMGLRG